MDKQLIELQQKKEDLENLKHEIFAINGDFQIARTETNISAKKIFALEVEIMKLESKKENLEIIKKFLRDKKNAYGFGYLAAVVILGFVAFAVGATNDILSGSIRYLDELALTFTGSYFVSTHSKRKSIKGINLDEVEVQLAEKQTEKEEQEKSYSLSIEKTQSLYKKLNNKYCAYDLNEAINYGVAWSQLYSREDWHKQLEEQQRANTEYVVALENNTTELSTGKTKKLILKPNKNK